MIINENINKKSFYQKEQKPKIRISKLLFPNGRQNNSNAKKIFKKSKSLFFNNESSSKNFAHSNFEISKENKDIDDEKFIVSKYINESKLKERSYMNQTLFDTKENTYRPSMKHSWKIPTLKHSLITDRKYLKNKQLPSLFISNQNSLIHKIRKKFLENKDYKDYYLMKNRADNYKKKVKSINSTFTQENISNSDKKLIKSFSAKSLIYNDSLFNKHKKNKTVIYSNLKSYEDYINREKYKFKINPLFSGKGINMKDFSRHLKKMGKDVEKIVESTIHMRKVNYFSLIDEKKFSKKFRKTNIYENVKKINGFQMLGKQYKNLMNKNIFKDNIQLLKVVNEEIEKKQDVKVLHKLKVKNQNKLNNNHSIIERFKKTVIKISSFLKQRKITDEDFRNYKLITKSFTYPQTKILINAIRYKNLNLCHKILNSHKYIILDFDYFYLTPLHWAVKKNFYTLLPALLDYGSILDACNILGETPLHISVKKNYFDCTCILLYYLASPFVKDTNGKTPIELTNDFEMKYLLTKIMKLHYTSFFQKTLVQDDFIQSGLWVFIKEEFHHKLQEEVFLFFKRKEIKDIFTLNY